MKKGTKKVSKKQGKKEQVKETHVETAAQVEAGPEATPEKAEKPEKPAKATKKPVADLDALRKPVEEAQAALTAAEVEAGTLESEARDIRAKAKAAFQEILAPYRDACRRAKVECEFGGTRAADVSERVSFLVEKTPKGVRIMVKGKPETDEVIPFKALDESIPKGSYLDI